MGWEPPALPSSPRVADSGFKFVKRLHSPVIFVWLLRERPCNVLRIGASRHEKRYALLSVSSWSMMIKNVMPTWVGTAACSARAMWAGLITALAAFVVRHDVSPSSVGYYVMLRDLAYESSCFGLLFKYARS